MGCEYGAEKPREEMILASMPQWVSGDVEIESLGAGVDICSQWRVVETPEAGRHPRCVRRGFQLVLQSLGNFRRQPLCCCLPLWPTEAVQKLFIAGFGVANHDPVFARNRPV